MKMMTCRDLGGPCDAQHHGEDANVIIKAQDKHLREMVGQGNLDHEPALKEMKGRWKNPLSGMKWYKNTKREFAARAED